MEFVSSFYRFDKSLATNYGLRHEAWLRGEWHRHPFIYGRGLYYLVSKVGKAEKYVCKAKKHLVNMRITTILDFAKVAYYLCGKDALGYWLEIMRLDIINFTLQKVEIEVGAV